MAYATTVIQDYTDALIANLKARTGLSDVFITDGPPLPAQLGAVGADMIGKWLMLGDVQGGQTWAAIDAQRRPRNEEFTITCVISVVQQATVADDIQADLNRSAIAIFQELEQELRANPTQGVGPATGTNPAGYVIESQIANPDVQLQKRATDTVREAAMQFGIHVKARL